MPRYKVDLISIDQANDEKDCSYKTFVEADGKDDAINKARVKQKDERLDFNPAHNWAWHVYETAEEGTQED